MEISYKVGVGLPAYEVIDRTYGKKSFTLDYIDRIDIKFEPGRETERFYWWMKTNPPAHWSMSEDGSFYFNEISEDGTLINYYNVSLKFEQPNNVGTSKPSYDFCCVFLDTLVAVCTQCLQL